MTDLLHEVLYGVLWNVGGGGLVHGAFHHGGLHVQVLELLLELVHQARDLLQVHRFHRCRHALQCKIILLSN
jgi:hypothetical protein